MSVSLRRFVPALDVPHGQGYHLLAQLSVAGLTGASLAVLYHVVDVVGGVTPFLFIVAVTIALAAAARFLPQRTAIAVAVVLLGIGLGIYVLTMPASRIAQLSLSRLTGDMIALLTGYSVLRMTNVQNWALAVTGGPTFLTWYFTFRREYVPAAVVGGLTLGFFVLTGDSGAAGTMIGVLGAVGAVGFGTLGRIDASVVQGEVLAGIFALMVVGAGTVTAVPGGGSPLVPPEATSFSGDLVSADSRVAIGGAIDLSPKVLFTVDAEEPAYWRVAAYDRFTGSTWLRTGRAGGGTGPPPDRPGRSYELEQVFTARSTLDVYPAAPTPVEVDGIQAQITAFGDIRSQETLRSSDRYRVVSERPVTTPRRLRGAGTDYPDRIADRYLGVPESTTQRVRRLAEQIAGDASTPYAKAKAIERWLENAKGYSLSVERPSGNVVDSFLFEMQEGYCVYFASAMAVMLRTQGVPARFVVGYTPGQQVDDDSFVVRGVDSHAWVEVYFPDVGWVRFDPTPERPRIVEERQRIVNAREEGISGVDALGSSQENFTSTVENIGEGGNQTNITGANNPRLRSPQQLAPFLNASISTRNTTGELNATVGPIDTESGGGSQLPPPRTLTIWGVVAFGLLAGARRTRLGERIYRYLWLHWLPRGDPETEIDGAFERVAYLLRERTRRRHAGETVREYVRSVTDDERVTELVRLREAARYGGRAREPDAESARELARAVIGDHVAGSRFSPSTMFNRLLS
ncbi:MAG: DUF3488 and DUF4129 domain-containing transglutaminase family protein [Halodesulfurarchaeum sp.]